MDSPVTPLNKALLVFTRHLVDEMRYLNYPNEWSRPPLQDLLPVFFSILNYHSDKLGSILQQAHERTFPKMMQGNVNQLGVKMAEVTKDYELFGKTQQYYLDEYDVMNGGDIGGVIDNDALAKELLGACTAIVDTFAGLTSTQENEHRTLEHICFALAPVCRRVRGTEQIGWELVECADNWRLLETDERQKLKDSIINNWMQ